MADWRTSARQQGIALVVVLWTVMLLAIIASNLAYTMHIETTLASSGVKRAQAHSLAEAGIAYAVRDLFRPRQARRLFPDGTRYYWRFGGRKVIVSVQDVGGLIDLNTASRALLRHLLAAAGAGREKQTQLLDAIADWRDPDSLSRLHGAEDEDYAAAGLPYGARDGSFKSVAGLQKVLGMTPALYQKIEEALTVFSGQAGIDPSVAPMAVLRVVPGIDLQTIAHYRARRRERRAAGKPPPPFPALGLGGAYFSQSSGSVYKIRAEAEMSGGGSVVVVAVVSLSGAIRRPYKVLKWKEG